MTPFTAYSIIGFWRWTQCKNTYHAETCAYGRPDSAPCQKAVELELEKRKALDLPIAVYDKKEKRVYACFADGTKIPMSEYEKGL